MLNASLNQLREQAFKWLTRRNTPERIVNQVIVGLRSSPFAVETSVFDTTSCRGFAAFLKQAGDG